MYPYRQEEAIRSYTAAGAECLFFLEAPRYDESTMNVAIGHDIAEAIPGENATREEFVELMGRGARLTAIDKQAAKLFQTQLSWAMLFVKRGPVDPDNPGVNTDVYHLVTAEALCAMQVLSTASTECMLNALRASSVVRPDLVKAFLGKLRFATSDRLAAQFAAERLLAQERSWLAGHLGCEVHMSANSMKNLFHLLGDAITSVIHFELSLKPGNYIRTFRRAMYDEILADLRLYVGEPPEAVAAHRRKVLTVFLGVGRRRRLLQTILQCLPNGDWREDHHCEAYISPALGPIEDEVRIKKLIARGTVFALTHESFRVFERDKWTNNDFCISQLGLIDSCHNLLRRSYARWLSYVGVDQRAIQQSGILGAPDREASPPWQTMLWQFLMPLRLALRRAMTKMSSTTTASRCPRGLSLGQGRCHHGESTSRATRKSPAIGRRKMQSTAEPLRPGLALETRGQTSSLPD